MKKIIPHNLIKIYLVPFLVTNLLLLIVRLFLFTLNGEQWKAEMVFSITGGLLYLLMFIWMYYQDLKLRQQKWPLKVIVMLIILFSLWILSVAGEIAGIDK